MRCFDLSSLRFGAAMLIALVVISSGIAPVSAQPPGPSDGGGFRRSSRPGGDTVSILFALRDEKFKEKISLTEEQQRKFDQLRMDMFTAFRSGASREEMPNIMKEFEQKAVDILSSDQKKVWETRKEELKAEQTARETERSGSGRGPGEERGPGAERGPGGRSPGAGSPPQQPPRRTEFTDEKPPEGAAVTASFGTRLANSAVADGKPEGGVPAVSEEGSRLSFNFRYAPWSDVLKLFSEAAGLTLDLNDVPPGTFNYYDDKTYSVTEALDVLNGYLLPKGFVLIRRDRFLVSLNLDNGPIPPSLIPNITVEELPQHGANELMSLVIPLEGFEADKAATEVKELLGPWGKVSALKNTNSLVVMDTGSNLNRVYRLLKSSSPIDNRETAFRAVPLKHITAAEAERTVRRLFGLNPTTTSTTTGFPQTGFSPFGGFGGGFNPGGFGGGFPGGFPGSSDRGRDDRGGDRGRDSGSSSSRPSSFGGSSSTPSPYAGKIQVTADTRTNHLLITASAALVKVVEEVVTKIDINKDSLGNDVVANDSPAFLKAYLVPGGDASQVSRTLNALMPGLVVGEDTRSGKIHVHATKEEHAEVEKLVQTLAGDTPSGSVAVINLNRLDPVQATNTIRNLFVNDPRAPMIEPDAFGRRLLVRGSADQLAQVKILLTQLGEVAAEPEVGVNVDRGTVRQIPLQGRAPEDVLPLIKQMWDAGGRNSIRVVVPSQPSPIRGRRVPAARNDPNATPTESEGLPGDRPVEEGSPIRRSSVPGARPSPQTQAPRRSSFFQVSRTGEVREDTQEAPGSISTSTTEGAAPEEPAATEAAPGEAKVSDGSAPISISIIGDEMVITSSDKQALDQLEDMINTLTAAMPTRTRWTVFYLRSADATETAQMLERLFPQSSVTASTSSSDGLFGSLTSGLSTMGRGMMNVTGLNQTLGGAGNLRIITDIRSNALFVTGPNEMIREVEMMLELLDASELPESLRDRVPRSIPVVYSDIDEVAEIVESVFKESMNDANQQGGQGGQRFNPLAMLMGGGAGGGGGNNRRQQQGPELSVGVDRRTSHLIVASSESLFKQVEGLVNSIELRAKSSRQTVQIMKLETADPALVATTLSSLIPKVSVSSSSGGSRSGSNRSRQSRDQNNPGGGDSQGQQPPDATRDADLMRRMMEQRSQSRGGGGGFPGGGFPGGGFGGGRFGGRGDR